MLALKWSLELRDDLKTVLPILNVLSDGEFHSGQALGHLLGVSRAAIWKHIQQLKEIGVELEAVTGKGYRVEGGLQLLELEKLLVALSADAARCLDERVLVHLSTDSTNADAMTALAGDRSPCLVVAEHQRNGRGRRGKKWVSPFGANIYLSLAWTFESGVAALEGLSLACGVAVLRALKKQGYSGISLKWPNDILVGGAKLGGILVEVGGDVAGPCYAVIGIGVNTRIGRLAGMQIDQVYSDLAGLGEGGVDRNALLAAMVNELVAVMMDFERQGFAGFREEWMAADYYSGKPVEIHSGSRVTKGVPVGVDLSGNLLLETAAGQVKVIGGEMLPSLRPVATQ
ncbi:bifunctional ligase/repressor BirA [Pseudohongiella nitratireducens]|uniref:Bifunctional ligase/repressor BirA n=1 Tax=Pseudohongiella nitratireducens TaxID=1768907 RepID=A0A916QKJ9_9GAMM|nr:bifunctional ligase/repressor BirA [Pseudohongiella nitratireducens]